jgi:hypothetical protein
MKTTNIANIIKELRRQEFCEIDSLEKMGCDAEEIEAALGVVTVEPNYDTDGHGRAVDMVTVDGRRFAARMTSTADLPMRWSERVENEQIVAAVGRQHRRHRG